MTAQDALREMREVTEISGSMAFEWADALEAELAAKDDAIAALNSFDVPAEIVALRAELMEKNRRIEELEQVHRNALDRLGESLAAQREMDSKSRRHDPSCGCHIGDRATGETR